MIFIGLDLAWSTKNQSGLAVFRLEQNCLIELESTLYSSDEDILAAIAGYPDAIIAIDAPLVVPNDSGRRVCEAECAHVFRKFHAGPHPSNRALLSKWTGSIRGEALAKKLQKKGFIHDPTGQSKRSYFECYPHPASITLFNMQQILPYKARQKRSYETRWKALVKYASLLSQRENPQIQFSLPSPEGLRGKALKQFEDRIDAIFCAYIAAHIHLHQEESVVFGSKIEGTITVPCAGHLLHQS